MSEENPSEKSLFVSDLRVMSRTELANYYEIYLTHDRSSGQAWPNQAEYLKIIVSESLAEHFAPKTTFTLILQSTREAGRG